MTSPKRWQLWLTLILALLFTAAQFFYVYIPLSQLFFKSNNLSQSQISLLQAIPIALVLLLDIPTGQFADRFNCRLALLLGSIPSAAAFIIYARSHHSYASFIFGSILLGIGTAFIRGAATSLAIQCTRLLTADPKNHLFFWFARANILGMGLAEGTAALFAYRIVTTFGHNSDTFLGSQPAHHWLHSLGDAPRAATWLQGCVYAIMTLLALLMANLKPPRRPHYSIASNLRYTLLRPDLRNVVLYGAIIGCTTQTAVWQALVKFQELSLTPAECAQIWAYLHFGLAAFTFLVGPYEWLLGRQRALMSLVGLAAVGYILLLAFPVRRTLWLFAIFLFVRTVQMPIIQHTIALLVDDRPLTTIISVMSTLQFGIFIIMNVLLGKLVDIGTSRLSLLASTVIYGLAGFIAARALQRTPSPHI